MLNIPQVRNQFPALARNAIYLDNPAGTQAARQSVERISRYLYETNANHGGAFATSRESDAVVDEARAACAELYNARQPEEIVFGPNMTTLTFALSRAIALTLQPGDTLVVTRLDHDANITPWTRIAADRGANVEWVDFDVETGTLRLETLEKALEKKPKLVAVGYASNALGTVNPVQQITRMAKAAGALVFIDAVQYAPHGVIDVQALGCDFLASSAYKWFGPHIGVMYGRYELLDQLNAYKVRPSSPVPPGKWETGTQSFEGIAGVLGALEYIEWVGTTFGSPAASRRSRLVEGLNAIHRYEQGLSAALLNALADVPGVEVYGLTDLQRLDERVPTVAFRMAGYSPEEIARHLDSHNIYVWNGNYYALSVTERLGVEDKGGMVRVGPVHYNTVEEIQQLGAALHSLA